MSKRTAAFVIALLACPMLAICQNTVMPTWSADSRNMVFALVMLGAAFYIGLDLVIAPDTSLLYRIVENNPFSWWKPLTAVRITAVFLILFSLLFGWMFIAQLLGLIK